MHSLYQNEFPYLLGDLRLRDVFQHLCCQQMILLLVPQLVLPAILEGALVHFPITCSKYSMGQAVPLKCHSFSAESKMGEGQQL